MARKTVTTSDLTGQEVVAPAQIRLQVGSDIYVLDVDEGEQIVQNMIEVGRKQKKRGRKPKVSA